MQIDRLLQQFLLANYLICESLEDALGNGTVGANDNVKKKVKSAWAELNDTEKAYWQTEDFRFQVWCEDPVCDDDTEILYEHQCVKYNLKLTETTTVELNGIEFSRERKTLKDRPVILASMVISFYP